jgi:hypothetical protein
MTLNGMRVLLCFGMFLPFCSTLLAQETKQTSSI